MILYDKDKKWCAYKSYDTEKVEIVSYKNSRCSVNGNINIVGITKNLSDKYNDGIMHGDSTLDGEGITFHGHGFVDAGYEFHNGMTFVARFKTNEVSDDQEVQGVLGNWEGAGGRIATKGGAPYGSFYTIEYNRVYFPYRNLGEYHTVTFVYDQNKIVLYVDGIKSEELEVTGDVLPSMYPFYVGGNPPI